MGFISTSVRRPIAVLMITLGFVLFGAVSCSNLEVTLLPDLNYPTLTVRTDYVGAAPAEVETLLSKPVEEALGIVKNLREVRSVSRAGQSDVVLEFAWGTEMDFAVLDVRERLDALELPDEASRPLVLRFDPSEDPIVRLALSLEDETTPTTEELKRLRRAAEDQVQRPLESVIGVAAVKISGGLEDEIQILLDIDKVAQLQMTPAQIAPMCVYLVSDKATEMGVTGQIFGSRMNEQILFGHNRPIRSIHREEGWTPRTIHEEGMPALKPSFIAMDRSADTFSWDPI